MKNMPSKLLRRYWLLHMIFVAGSLVYFTRIGRGTSFLRGQRDALRWLPSVLQKRRLVQALRTTPSEEIDRLLSRKWLGLKLRKIWTECEAGERQVVTGKST